MKSDVAKPGETKRFTIPDSLEGTRFTLGRIVKMVQEAKKDPLVIETGRQIAGLATAGKKWKNEVGRKVRILRAIHAWCRGNFQYVDDPAGVELIQTPNRMLRVLKIPQALHEAMWEPIGKILGGNLPKPVITGDSDEAATLVLALAAAVGFDDLVLRLGGTEGVIHYAWAGVRLEGKVYEIDVFHEKFGGHHTTHLENMDVPVL